MSVLYQIGIIDKVTAGFGTVYVKTSEQEVPVYFTPEHPEEAVAAFRKEVSNEQI